MRGLFRLTLHFFMNNPPSFSKTRIAPTPSGYLHLGNVMSFLITSALAKKHQAKLFLRIDDLDSARVQDKYIIDIFDTLNFMDIPYDEGPKNIVDFKSNYSQIHRLGLYEKALEGLVKKDACFACDCSRKILAESGISNGYPGFCKQLEIPLTQKGCCWRFRTNQVEPVSIIIYPGNAASSPFPTEMKDFVVRKKDRYPAYQLSSVVDDVHFGIDFIVRGADLWNSTLAQIQLAENIPEGRPFLKNVFYHHLLVKDGRNKLSKSSGSTSIQYLRKNGAKKADIFKHISKVLNFSISATSMEEFTTHYFQEISQQ